MRFTARSTKQAAARSPRAATLVARSLREMRSGVAYSLWGAALRVPGVPDRVRHRISDIAHRRLVRAGRPKQAALISAAAVRRLRNRRLRDKALFRQAGAEVVLGTPPSLSAAVEAELSYADAALARGEIRKAVGSVRVVAKLLFDRRLHFDRLTSPLADDAAGFLREWHASAAVRALCAPRGRSGSPDQAPPSGRPTRLLMTTYGNPGFIELIQQHFEQRQDVELRFADLSGDGVHAPLLKDQRAMMEQILGGDPDFGERVREWLDPQVQWADVVFVDWCAAHAVAMSMIDPGSTRVIVRLHSFEAFALWPHLVDFSRVDALVLVSDHLRDLVADVIPSAGAEGGTELVVAPNAMDLRSFDRPKSADARFTLGLVGIKAVAKDPLWAVEVLRHLRAHDSRYRLLLFGKEIDTSSSTDAADYWNGAVAAMADLEESGAVVRMGHVADVQRAMTDVGVILSSSVRESFHCGLVEGAASAAVPIVRDWPFFAGRSASARTLFPADWMVDTPEEAARRIIEVTSTEESWRAAGVAARDHAVITWDWQTVKHQFDRIVLGA